VAMIHVEQLVYGTFPFTQGFTLVGKSAGIDGPLAQAAIGVCKSWGEVGRPEFRSALLHVRLLEPEDRHLVSKVIRQGTDRGDRMAWYQQVLLLTHEDYLSAGADCFAFEHAGFFKERWFESDQCQPHDVEAGILAPLQAGAVSEEQAPLVQRVALALQDGRAVRFQAGEPCRFIDALCRGALAQLPVERRAQIALASFAYRPVRRYDLWCAYESGGGCPAAVDQVQVRIE
jgi:hypothetical protein